MRVIGEAFVRQAAAAGRKTIVVGPRDILTPQARDTLVELGLRVVAEEEIAAPPAADGPTAMRRVLVRRSPRWVPPEPGRRPGGRVLDRVAVVGAGAVGATTAHVLAMEEAAREVVLVDIAPGLAESVALDLEHASGITGSTTRCRGGTSLGLLAAANVVVITAGRPRQPGMNRRDLTEVNGKVVRSVAEAVAEHAPDAVVVVVTNPLDEMTYAAYQATSFPRERVLGMAGTLDSSRFRWSLAMAAGAQPRDVAAITLGSHGDEMVPVVSLATIRGRPVREVLDEGAIARCVEETVHAGGTIVQLRKTGSAFYGPGHAIAEVVGALRGTVTEPIPVSVLLRGEYGLDDVVLGVPCRLGPDGLVEVVELPLTPEEEKALHTAAAAVRERIGS